ncbi:hypothetical protein [Pleomorphovibrio marinus]|uniref:hypothetical protein n=1 Tax=Pleomorphovibrio marinus TaxID=2164132 RepID=UPI000E0BDF18|nr:hypothetical protein [Pleomorphovibrio marinus]
MVNIHYLVFFLALLAPGKGPAFYDMPTPKAGNEILLENQSYTISKNPELELGEWIIQRKDDKSTARKISSEFTVFYADQDPLYGFGKRATGGSPVANWGEGDEVNVWKSGQTFDLFPTNFKMEGNSIMLSFTDSELFSFSATLSLPDGEGVPQISWKMDAKADGYFAAVFSGISERAPDKLDFLYQPLIWSWKRFPDQAVLTPESYATTPSVFTTENKVTEGLAIPSAEIPYRFATASNSRFGVMLRTNKGTAKPMVMAPIMGGEESFLKKGNSHEFSIQYYLASGNWMEGVDYLYQKVMQYPLERQNAMVSLNETFHNIIDLSMDDYYSGWLEEYKGYDYKFDVPNTVKNVSAIHPLSIAFTTDSKQIYDRRGLPMLEYLMSREKYLYAINAFPEKQTQNPSHFLKGPAMELWEMASIHQLLGENNTALPKEMERLFGKSRQLNLQTEVSGASWKDYLARYLVNHGQEYLDTAILLADEYLDLTFHQYPTDFSTNAGLRDAQATFVNDYSSTWQELLELYELTQDQKYLDAAYEGAKQLSLWTRSTPFAPDNAITVNEGGKVEGIFPGRRFKPDSYEWQEFDMTTRIQEQVVPAWHTSLVGLLPEQPGTYVYGPIMLFHQAGAMLRLAHLKNDKTLRNIAYNGILGRYNNFPGYYFTSFFTNVYQQTNYPLHPYLDIRYNAVFYNHLWPHVALIQDFLVSDAYYRSGGKIDFPSLFSPGYAFLSNKVYGHAPGNIHDHENVSLWLPKNPFRTKEKAFNHLLGRDGENTFIVFMNTSPTTISDTIHLNKEVFKWDVEKEYAYEILEGNVKGGALKLKNGNLPIQIAPMGITVVKIKGLSQLPDFPGNLDREEVAASGKERYYRKEYPSPALGTLTGMSFVSNKNLRDFYIYSTSTGKSVSKVQLAYQIGDEEWQEEVDNTYPFEFSLRVEKSDSPIKFKWNAIDRDGELHESEIIELQ